VRCRVQGGRDSPAGRELAHGGGVVAVVEDVEEEAGSGKVRSGGCRSE